MKTYKIAWSFIAIISVSGCGNWNSVYHTHKFTNDSSALVDINTRNILSSTEITDTTDPKTGITTRITSDRVCAEPSPDALTTYAANASASDNVANKINATLSGGYTSTGLYVGNRTETVQLLRDQLYRLCEAYINNAINKDTYEMLLLRSQRYTLALMATDSISQMEANTKQATNSTLQASDAQKNAQNKLAQLQKDEIDLNNSDSADKSTKIAENKKQQDAQSKIIADEQAKAKANLKAPNTNTTNTSQNSNNSAAVISIVNELVGSGDEAYMCFNYMRELALNNVKTTSGANAQAATTLQKFCTDVLTKISSDNTGAGIKYAPNKPVDASPPGRHLLDEM